MSTTHRHTGLKVALGILAFFTLLSLAANAFLLWLLWNGWQVYQQQVPTILEEAVSLGRSLQEQVREPLRMEIPVHQEITIQKEVPINHTVQVVIDDVASVDKTFHFEWDLPVVGLVTKTLPVHLDVPLHIETPVHVSTTVPLSLTVPVHLTVPVELDWMDLPLGRELARLGEMLEGLARQEQP